VDGKLMTRRFIALIVALLPVGALAQMPTAIVWDTHHAGFVGPCDLTAFTAWYGLRACSAAVAATGTQPSVDLFRNDGATCTALIATDGTLDLTVGTPCNGNTQTVTAWANAGGSGTCTGHITGFQLFREGCSSGTMHYGDQVAGIGVTPGTYITNVSGCDINDHCLVNFSQTVGNGTALTVTPFGIQVARWYDQTAGNACGGASCDVLSPTTTGTSANAPLLFLTGAGSGGTLPHLESVAQGVFISANAFTPGGVSLSFALVGERLQTTAAGGALIDMSNSGVNFIHTDAADTWKMQGNVGSLTFTATDVVLHSAVGVIQAGASAGVANLDGSETTGTTNAPDTAAHAPRVNYANGSNLIVDVDEAGWKDGTAFSGALRTNLCHNMRLYWGTPGSC
jgi:hypothetical protein